MKVEWFKGLSADEAEKMKKIVSSNKIMLDKLSEICYNRLQALNSITEEDYDSPSWAHKQAHINGYKHALKDLQELLKIK